MLAFRQRKKFQYSADSGAYALSQEQPGHILNFDKKIRAIDDQASCPTMPEVVDPEKLRR